MKYNTIALYLLGCSCSAIATENDIYKNISKIELGCSGGIAGITTSTTVDSDGNVKYIDNSDKKRPNRISPHLFETLKNSLRNANFPNIKNNPLLSDAVIYDGIGCGIRVYYDNKYHYISTSTTSDPNITYILSFFSVLSSSYYEEK